MLPVDVRIAAEFNNDSPSEVVPVDSIPADKMGLDIGTKTIENLKKLLKRVKP